ncbi:MAG: ABC transporter substrate-binding protein [Candidatus Nanoperiomorbaceae bacterium]
MKKFARTAIAAVTVAMLAFAGACGSSSATGGSSSSDAETVTIGTSNDAPLAFIDKSGNLTGIDGDIMMAVAKENGWKVKNSVSNFSTLIASLNTNKIDIINDSMRITPERQKKVNFSDPFYNLSDSIIVKKSETAVTGYDQLKGKPLGTVTGTVYPDLLNKLSPGKVKLFDSQATMIQAIVNGDIFGGVTDQPVAAYSLKQDQSLKIRVVNAPTPYFLSPVAPSVRLDDKTRLAAINSGLKKIKANGEYDKIMKKWDMPKTAYIK